MPGMKVTVDAAMRARDVSRPHAEHEARAASEPQPARIRDRGPEPLREEPAEVARGSVPPGAAGGASKGRLPRRRRRRR